MFTTQGPETWLALAVSDLAFALAVAVAQTPTVATAPVPVVVRACQTVPLHCNPAQLTRRLDTPHLKKVDRKTCNY